MKFTILKKENQRSKKEKKFLRVCIEIAAGAFFAMNFSNFGRPPACCQIRKRKKEKKRKRFQNPTKNGGGRNHYSSTLVNPKKKSALSTFKDPLWRDRFLILRLCDQSQRLEQLQTTQESFARRIHHFPDLKKKMEKRSEK